jgi:hypothetical protein
MPCPIGPYRLDVSTSVRKQRAAFYWPNEHRPDSLLGLAALQVPSNGTPLLCCPALQGTRPSGAARTPHCPSARRTRISSDSSGQTNMAASPLPSSPVVQWHSEPCESEEWEEEEGTNIKRASGNTVQQETTTLSDLHNAPVPPPVIPPLPCPPAAKAAGSQQFFLDVRFQSQSGRLWSTMREGQENTRAGESSSGVETERSKHDSGNRAMDSNSFQLCCLCCCDS